MNHDWHSGHTAIKPHKRTSLSWWLVTILLNGLRVAQYLTRRPPLLQRSLWATPLICCFGVPCNFIATKRTNFQLKVFDEVCRPLEIEKTCTTSTDRLSVFMEPSLKCYMGGSCNTWDWDLQLPACMMTYRGAVYESTWVLSNLLMLGTWMS